MSPQDYLSELGMGMHALMDSTSPSHEGFQSWYGVQWYNPISWAEGINHTMGESLFPYYDNKITAMNLISRYYEDFKDGCPCKQ